MASPDAKCAKVKVASPDAKDMLVITDCGTRGMLLQWLSVRLWCVCGANWDPYVMLRESDNAVRDSTGKPSSGRT